MPMVTIARPRLARAKESFKTCWNFFSSGMTWSAGKTAMTPVVERAPTNAAPSVTAAQGSRPIGSARRFCFGDVGKLFAGLRQLRLVGDDENVFGRHERQDAVNGLLEERAFAHQCEQLLGHFLAAHRPEPLAPAAGHDDDETVFDVSLRFHFN